MICSLCKMNLLKGDNTYLKKSKYKNCYVCTDNWEESEFIYYCKSCKSLIICDVCKICDNEHFLKKVTFLENLNSGYHNNEYICNICNKSKRCDDNGIWHCNDCNFDVCTECLP